MSQAIMGPAPTNETAGLLHGIEGIVLPSRLPEGESLSRMLHAGPLPSQSFLEIAIAISNTLAQVHQRGVLHRNINPDHIWIGREGKTLLAGFERSTPFGVERVPVSQDAESLPTLWCRSPEETGRTGRKIDLRSDLYSLGAMLYACATGRKPFDSGDLLQLVHQILTRPPADPSVLHKDVPPILGRIILRLLEKDPEHRYQSASGLSHDLSQAARALASGGAVDFDLGAFDFPLPLAGPVALHGRDIEIAELQSAFAAACNGETRIVLVSGAAGVGKTSLINRLRPVVATVRGWFVVGKFDQYRQDPTSGAAQAFRGLAKLLLALPEAELQGQTRKIRRMLGGYAGLMTGAPEFALLLGAAPEVHPPKDATQGETRLALTQLDFLRAIATPARPVIVALDDLQWSGLQTIRLFEACLDSSNTPGLLLVGTFRDSDGETSDALMRFADAHRGHPALLHVPLRNLPPANLGSMVSEMLRLPEERAAGLVKAIHAHTGGNPYDTVEMLNSLRGDGSLHVGAGGWEWNSESIVRRLGKGGVLSMLASRIDQLPADAKGLLREIACLGDEVEEEALEAATGVSPEELRGRLSPVIDEGLVTIDTGEVSSVKLRHDRVRQAVYDSMDPTLQRSIHLQLARRLAAAPKFRQSAVHQYLHAIGEIVDDDECLAVANDMHEASRRAAGELNFELAERLLSAADSLLGRLPDSREIRQKRADVKVARHIALCNLSRFEEADALFAAIEKLRMPIECWVDAACAQVHNLVSRSRLGDALALGLGLLRELGLPVDEAHSIDAQVLVRDLGSWLGELGQTTDSRPYTGDLRTTAAARLIKRLAYPAYFKDLHMLAWLIRQAEALWIANGPSPDLAHALGSASAVAVLLKKDFRTAYAVARHVLDVCEARGWEPGASEARYLFLVHAAHWFEPMEKVLHHVRETREGLFRNGDIENVCYSFRIATTAMLECEPSLDTCAAEVEAGLALALRIKHEYMLASLGIERRMIRRLQEIEPDHAAQPEHLAAIERQSQILSVSLPLYCTAALVSAMFGDWEQAGHDAAIAVRQAPYLTNYRVSTVRLLHAIATARRLPKLDDGQRERLLREIDDCRDWMEARAADSPENFLLQLKWIDAERAWSVGDLRQAGAGFEAALRQAEVVNRPYLLGMVAESAAQFHLELGLEGAARSLVARAREVFSGWGAHAKVRQMTETYSFLAADAPLANERNADPGTHSSIDSLAILRASHALSSETNLARLETKLAAVMKALTGATSVQLVIWDQDRTEWLASPLDQADRVTVEEAAERGLLAISAFRYAERTREPLVVADASEDDRFMLDPYCETHRNSSLLVLPILDKGAIRAIVFLANHQARGAFSEGRLQAVTLIAGQLAVSLENARLYDRLERRVQDQTRELIDAARRAGMAQVASNVLHNVGNVLNSVNVSARLLVSRLGESRVARVADLAVLMEHHSQDLPKFFADQSLGARVPSYLADLAVELERERQEIAMELNRLMESVDQIKNVVDVQQSLAGSRGVLQTVNITELMEGALTIQTAGRSDMVSVHRHYGAVKPCAMDKGRVMQILVNLIDNARHAMNEVDGERILSLRVNQSNEQLTVEVSDNGCGIAAENLPQVFTHGFTTKPGGHGFGLHSSAVAASEMGGSLSVRSAGMGRGASFTLCLPIRHQARGGTNVTRA